jgi:hypothetical protein
VEAFQPRLRYLKTTKILAIIFLPRQKYLTLPCKGKIHLPAKQLRRKTAGVAWATLKVGGSKLNSIFKWAAD